MYSESRFVKLSGVLLVIALFAMSEFGRTNGRVKLVAQATATIEATQTTMPATGGQTSNSTTCIGLIIAAAIAILGFLSFVIPGVGNWFIKKLLDVFVERIPLIFRRRRWRKEIRMWEGYDGLFYGFELIKSGWNGGVFSEAQVIVTVADDEFELPDDIATRIRDKHKPVWEAKNQKNNLQVGVSSIDAYRNTDEHERGTTNIPSHELNISGHRYYYFDMLATNSTYLNSKDEEELKLLREKFTELDALKPVPSFANPLAVGLSLFCEGGDCLILMKRTDILSSGGGFFPGSVFNAVAENVNPRDGYSDQPTYNNRTRLSPWATAKRGLWEEMGISISSGLTFHPILHSFIWDKRILDYKFFGYVINGESRAVVKQYWKVAPDKDENKAFWSFDCGNKRQCLDIIETIIRDRIINDSNEWSSEATFCTIMSLVHLNKISIAHDVVPLIDKTNKEKLEAISKPKPT